MLVRRRDSDALEWAEQKLLQITFTIPILMHLGVTASASSIFVALGPLIGNVRACLTGTNVLEFVAAQAF